MSDRDPEIIDIQETWFRDNCGNKRWVIVEVPSGYELHIHDRDNVSPVVTYSTKREVAARLLQLLNIGPVAPQIHAEEVEIGSVELTPSAP